MRSCICGRIIPATDRRRPEHARAENSRRAQKAKRNGLKTSHWREVRQARLQLDGGLCTLKLNGCTGYAETVHLAPELGGNHQLATLDNTRSACRHCHGVVDAPRSHQGRGAGLHREN
jgi:hypothetical protein